MEIAEFATIFFLLIPVTYVIGYFTGKMDAEETHAKQQIVEGVRDLAERVERTKKMLVDEARRVENER